MEVERKHEGNLSLPNPARQWRNGKPTLVTTVLSLHQTSVVNNSEWFDPGRSQASEGLNIEMFQVLLLFVGVGRYLKYRLKSLVSLGYFSTSAGRKGLAPDFILILLRKWWWGTSYFICYYIAFRDWYFLKQKYDSSQTQIHTACFLSSAGFKLKCTHTRPARWPHQLTW